MFKDAIKVNYIKTWNEEETMTRWCWFCLEVVSEHSKLQEGRELLVCMDLNDAIKPPVDRSDL